MSEFRLVGCVVAPDDDDDDDDSVAGRRLLPLSTRSIFLGDGRFGSFLPFSNGVTSSVELSELGPSVAMKSSDMFPFIAVQVLVQERVVPTVPVYSDAFFYVCTVSGSQCVSLYACKPIPLSVDPQVCQGGWLTEVATELAVKRDATGCKALRAVSGTMNWK